MDSIRTSQDGVDKDSDWSLTGFLFGNINEKGELEDESILDEVSLGQITISANCWFNCRQFLALPHYFYVYTQMSNMLFQ